MKLRLIEAAKTGLYDYFLVQRALEINTESLRLLREFRENAETRYRTALVTQQDVLQAEVELGREERRRLSLLRMRQVAVARVNTLLNLAPDAPLPPPPRTRAHRGAAARCRNLTRHGARAPARPAGGKIPFLSLIEAQRNLIGLRDQYFEAVSDYFRRLAILERVGGGPFPIAPFPAKEELSGPAR